MPPALARSATQFSSRAAESPHVSADLRDQYIGHFWIFDPSRQHDEHVRLRRVDDRGVVTDARDPSGLVRHARAGWHAGRNAVIELLTRQDVDHRGARALVHRLAAADLEQ